MKKNGEVTIKLMGTGRCSTSYIFLHRISNLPLLALTAKENLMKYRQRRSLGFCFLCSHIKTTQSRRLSQVARP